MNMSYFKWLIKSRKISIIFFILIYIAFQLIPFTSFDPEYLMNSFVVSTYVGFFLSVAMSVATPVFLFSYIHRKSSVDMFLALPVSRRDQLITNLVFSWLMSYGSFFMGTALVWLTRSHNVVSVGRLASIQLFAAFALAVLVLVHSAVYTLANSIFDGIIMIGAYTLLPAIVGISALSFISSMIAGRNVPSDSLVNQIGVYLSPLFMSASNISALLEFEYSSATFHAEYLISMAIFAILSIVLLKTNFINRKSERAGQISDHILSYPFIINTYLILILFDLAWYMISTSLSGLEFYYLLLFFIYVVASFIYKRTIKISVKPIMFFICACIVTVGFAKVGWATEGFGLSNLPYNLFSGKYLYYEYGADCTIEDLGEDALYDHDDEYARVSFTLEIPRDEKADYQEIIDKLEAYRQQSKSYFYTVKMDDDSSVLFEVYNRNKSTEYSQDNYYSYPGAYALSESELKDISKYCEVTIYPVVSDPDNKYYRDDDADDMTLDEFLSWRKICTETNTKN